MAETKECPKSQLEPILRMDGSCTGMVNIDGKEILCSKNCYAAEVMRKRQEQKAGISLREVVN
ncbi:MAG: hypothetical protein WC784_04130 [Candidatus Shapirobacteria bacterium]|jgi:hypothetical protein